MTTIQFILMFIGFGLWFLAGYKIGQIRTMKKIRDCFPSEPYASEIIQKIK